MPLCGWWSENSHQSPYKCVCAKLLQSCPTLCNTMDCSPPGSSVHWILQARILEWFAMPFSRGTSWPRDGTCISFVSCVCSQVFFFFFFLPLVLPGKLHLTYRRNLMIRWGQPACLNFPTSLILDSVQGERGREIKVQSCSELGPSKEWGHHMGRTLVGAFLSLYIYPDGEQRFCCSKWLVWT